MMSVAEALTVVDDDLPDGAWMAALEELTGLDAGEVSSELARLSDNGRKWMHEGRFVEPEEGRRLDREMRRNSGAAPRHGEEKP